MWHRLWTSSLIFLVLTGATYPEPTGYVVDQAGILSEATKQQIAQQATALAQGTGPEIAVVTLSSIAPESIESYGIHLADRWKVGKRGLDNGVILLVAVQERKVRIEVGRGAEAVLTDAEAGRILASDVVPHLKRGDWDGGVLAGTQAIVRELTTTTGRTTTHDTR